MMLQFSKNMGMLERRHKNEGRERYTRWALVYAIVVQIDAQTWRIAEFCVCVYVCVCVCVRYRHPKVSSFKKRFDMAMKIVIDP